jgi:formate dehydrogenase maturation protein FdhE
LVNDESSIDPARVLAGLETLIGRENVSEAYVRFRIELLRAQDAALQGLAMRSRGPSPLAFATKRTDRNSAVDMSTMPLDRTLLARLLADLFDALGGPDHRSEDLARLSAASMDDPDLLEELARAAAFGPEAEYLESLSSRLEASTDGLVFFGCVLAAPFVTEAVRRLKRHRVEPPEPSGHCGWCGSPPGLAKLRRDDGRRVLFCSLCGQNWPFARLSCPFCQREDALERLRVDTGDRCSIDACSRCRNYLKTVDERNLPAAEPLIPLVQAVATLHLDLVAEREGYQRAMPYAAMQ